MEIWCVWSIPSLSVLPGSLKLRVLVPVRVSYIGQMNLFKKLFEMNGNTWWLGLVWHINHWRLFNAKSIFIQIIIIIMSFRQHVYPWPSLATSPYYSSPLAGLQGYILCPHIAAVCKFELVFLLLLGYMWGSIGVYHLWARPCVSSSVLRVWFIKLI